MNCGAAAAVGGAGMKFQSFSTSVFLVLLQKCMRTLASAEMRANT